MRVAKNLTASTCVKYDVHVGVPGHIGVGPKMNHPAEAKKVFDFAFCMAARIQGAKVVILLMEEIRLTS